MTNEKRNNLNRRVEQKEGTAFNHPVVKNAENGCSGRGNCTEKAGLGANSHPSNLAAYHTRPAASHRGSISGICRLRLYWRWRIGDVFKKETWIHILDIIKGKES